MKRLAMLTASKSQSHQIETKWSITSWLYKVTCRSTQRDSLWNKQRKSRISIELQKKRMGQNKIYRNFWVVIISYQNTSSLMSIDFLILGGLSDWQTFQWQWHRNKMATWLTSILCSSTWASIVVTVVGKRNESQKQNLTGFCFVP